MGNEIKLNKRQLMVVQSSAPRILCLASAAGGKTRVLTERIRYILTKKLAKPEEIVAITYTNQAAAEMYARLGKIAEGMFIGTIHAYANFLCSMFNIDTSNFIEQEDYDRILKKALTIPSGKIRKISYLFVDECQDIGDDEYSLLSRLPCDNQFWCGDDRQAIYEFKGGSVKYITDMSADPEFTKYYLVENYRNTPEIIKFAEDFLKTAPALSPKSIPHKTKNGFIEHCRFNIAYDDLKESGNWGSWFVLCRSNAQVKSVMKRMVADEIPCTTFKRAELTLEQMEDIMAKNSVKVLTCHASKGLEAPNVIVVGASIRTIEERRLAYVAATRAETNLYWCPPLNKAEGLIKEDPKEQYKATRLKDFKPEVIEF